MPAATSSALESPSLTKVLGSKLWVKNIVTLTTQVAAPHGLPPTPAKRSLFIVYQTAVPYIAERISSRLASHGIALEDMQTDEWHSYSSPAGSQIQSLVVTEDPSSSSSGASAHGRLRLKEIFNGLWLYAVRRWPTMLPIAREFLQWVLHANLMFFYFEGMYYHISKRAAGIRYVFIGKPSNQRPRYQILGVFLLIQLCIIAAEGLRRSNLSSIASSVHQTSLWSHETATGSQNPRQLRRNCIMEWCNEKPECPLCRTPIAHSLWVCLYHSEF